jgi:hypothetical protein
MCYKCKSLKDVLGHRFSVQQRLFSTATPYKNSSFSHTFYSVSGVTFASAAFILALHSHSLLMVAVRFGHSQNYKDINLLTIASDDNGEVCYLGGK